MNKKSFFVVLILFNFFISFSQSGIVSYNTQQYITEKLNTESDRVKKVADELELMTFTLSYNKEGSYYKKEKNLPKHSEFYARIARVLSGSIENPFQFLKTKESFQNVTIAGVTYQVDYSYKMKGWKLTEESKKIDNYTCYKAILVEYNDLNETFFETVAWYTPEIPVPYGPSGYGGLPGLILQLQYRATLHTVNKITFNPKNGVKVPSMEEGEKIDVKKMVYYMRKARKVTVD